MMGLTHCYTRSLTTAEIARVVPHKPNLDLVFYIFVADSMCLASLDYAVGSESCRIVCNKA